MIRIQSARLSGPPAGTSPVHVMAPLVNRGQVVQYDDHGDSRGAAGLSSGAPGVAATAQITLSQDGPSDSPAGWTFGWLSFCRFQVLDVTYRGAARSEGSVFAQWYPVDTQRQLRLDVAHGSGPWYTDHREAKKAFAAGDAFESTVNLRFNDTPNQTAMLAINNTAFPGRLVLNWLFRVWFRLEFTTVLAAWAPGAGRPQALKSFDWSVEWRLQFTPNLTDPAASWTWSPATPQGKEVGGVVDGIPSAHGAIASLFSSSWTAPTTLQEFNRRHRTSRRTCSQQWAD